jgi:hypothetical protein
MTDWKAEAEYWRNRHHSVLISLDGIKSGRIQHPDGPRAALDSLYYAETGARPPSPSERAEVRRLLEGDSDA